MVWASKRWRWLVATALALALAGTLLALGIGRATGEPAPGAPTAAIDPDARAALPSQFVEALERQEIGPQGAPTRTRQLFSASVGEGAGEWLGFATEVVGAPREAPAMITIANGPDSTSKLLGPFHADCPLTEPVTVCGWGIGSIPVAGDGESPTTPLLVIGRYDTARVAQVEAQGAVRSRTWSGDGYFLVSVAAEDVSRVGGNGKIPLVARDASGQVIGTSSARSPLD